MSYTAADFESKLVFDLSGATPGIKVRGNLTAANGADRVDAVFTITDPLGNVVYSNTDLSTPDLTFTSTTPSDSAVLVNVPTDQNGNLIEGNYTFSGIYRVYSVVLEIDSNADTLSIAQKTNGFFTAPSQFTLIDGTEPSLEKTYDITAVNNSGGFTVLTSSTDVPVVFAAPSYGLVFEVGADVTASATGTFCPKAYPKEADIVWSCLTETIQGNDNTAYPVGTVFTSKTQTLSYPVSLGKSPKVVTGNSNSVTIQGDLFTTAWTYEVDAEYEYESDNVVVIDSVDLAVSKDVVCLYDICKVICCMENINLRLQKYQEGTLEYQNAFNELTRVTQLVTLIEKAIYCDNEQIYQPNIELLNTILNASGDECGCGCGDVSNTTPTKITSPIDFDFSNTGGSISITDGTTPVSDVDQISFQGDWFTTSDLGGGTGQVDFNGASAETLKTSVSNNTSAVSTNASNISTNASNISTNESDIATNAANIAVNSAAISSLTGSLSRLSYEILDFDNLDTTPELMLDIPAGRAIMIHSAIVTFTGGFAGAKTASPILRIHTTSTYAASKQFGIVSLSSAVPEESYANFENDADFYSHGLGDDLYLSADVSPDWSPESAVITIYYALV